MEFKNKKIAIVGFGAEGRSAALFLVGAGAKVEIFDAKSEQDLPAGLIADLRDQGVQFHFGELGPLAGFEAVVRSPGISPKTPELAAAALSGVPFTSATKIFFDLCPCPIIGVTGTKGKGTTSSLLHQMLVASGKDAYLCGNIGTPALDLLGELKANSVVVYELSSFQLIEVDKSPSLAIVLMITNDHLDFHGTNEDYVSSKSNIVKFQKSGDRAIINMDYPSSVSMVGMAESAGSDVFSVSLKSEVARGAYVANGAVMVSQDGVSRKIIDINKVKLAGAHNLENVCAAVMAGVLFGVSDEVMVKTIQDFKALPHRLQFVCEVSGVKYYDDSISTTPESAIAALRSFKSPKIIILGGSSKGAEWNDLANQIATDPSLKAVVGIGQEWPKIKEAIVATGKEVLLMDGFKTMAEAVQSTAKISKSGDVVVLSPACASFDMFKNYQDRGDQFAAAARGLFGMSGV